MYAGERRLEMDERRKSYVCMVAAAQYLLRLVS